MTPSWPPEISRLHLESVDSTNAEAFRRAPSLAAPFWLFAGRQTAGRGRQGRPWRSLDGDFFGTLFMRLGESAERAALRSFAASLAVRDALLGLGARGEVFLKWPNDVLAGGRKISGILLESSCSASGLVDGLAVGIGVNLASRRGASTPDSSSLEDISGVRVPPERFLDALSEAYDSRERDLRSRGFAPVLSAWLSCAAFLGERITARMAGGSLSGVFETVDGSGRLVLNVGGRRRLVSSADIFFGGAHASRG